MLLIDLGGSWQMKRTDENEWIDACVPGSVYADLLKAGRMKDPFYRENEQAALDLCRYDYEYRREFSVDDTALSHEKIILLCEGLDTLCDLYLNGQKVLSSDNMHRAYEIDAAKLLVPGRNVIRAVFHSPIQYVLKKQAEEPLRNSGDAVPGISYLRKAHCMFGWDWGPKLPDMGIWRPISIRGYDAARLDDVYVTQTHADGKVDLDVRVGLEKWQDGPLSITVRITAPDGAVMEKKIRTEKALEHIPFKIDCPQLWWPNNLGAHPLYGVRITVSRDGVMLDEKKMRIGLRTLTVKREKDEFGTSFAFTVNGVPFFAMGADYIPEDNILSRCSRSRTEKLICSAVKANFNTIRVWGGGYYPDDYFYDLCDEYGLVVWQDLMYACGTYLLTDSFKETISAETIQNVKRIRHHASLGLWCGNNEQETGWADWGWSKDCPARQKADYIRMYEVLLPGLVKKNDPDTFWWPSSPSSGGFFENPNGQESGDMHYWDVWHGLKPFTAYREIFPRFLSEFGIQSFPCLKTVRTFTLPEDRNIFSPVMESHQKNSTGNEKILHYISRNYKYPKDFDSLLFVSQIIQAEGIRCGVEHLRRNRGRCMGTIYWQFNDCWPVASWSSVDFFGRWKVLQCLAKRFFAPVLASASEDGTSAALHVSNETPNAISGKLCWKLADTACNTMEQGETGVSLGAFSTGKFLDLDFARILDTTEKKRNAVLFYSFFKDGKTISRGTALFVKAKHLSLLDPRIKAQIREETDRFVLTLSAEAYADIVELSLTDADAVFSDNCFPLDAACETEVDLLKNDISADLTLEQLKKQLRIRSLYDTFEH